MKKQLELAPVPALSLILVPARSLQQMATDKSSCFDKQERFPVAPRFLRYCSVLGAQSLAAKYCLQFVLVDCTPCEGGTGIALQFKCDEEIR